jgi:hypothetical protein
MMRERLAAQLLSGEPAPSAEAVVDRLLAVQAQDPRGFRLAVRARSIGSGVTAADVDAALSDRRSLVVAWLNRGTLHLVRAEDYWWLHPLTTPQLVTANARCLGQEGVSPAQADRGVEVVVDLVSSTGPRTRDELREALDEAGVPTAGQALVHVLYAASLRHRLVRGPLRDGQQCFVDAENWLGPAPAPLERDEALARLARRYLRGHRPAADRDLAKWAGITLSDARRALAGAGPVDERPPAPPLPPPRLLGAFDPLLHGWASNDEVIGRHPGIVTNNGLYRPFALVRGRAVAIWSLRAGEVVLTPVEAISASTRRALEADAADVLRYLGVSPSAAGRPPAAAATWADSPPTGPPSSGS